jgi:hypothetical protein
MLEGAGHVVGGFKINPTFGIWGNVADAMMGKGATPSMGLSQVRGGARRKVSGEAKREAKEMGAHLSKYLTKLHGAGYARTFGKGFHAADTDSDSSSDSDNEVGHNGGNVSKSGRYEGMGHCGAGEMMPANDHEGGFFGPMPQKMKDRINEMGRKRQEAMKASGLTNKQIEHIKQMAQKKQDVANKGGRMTANQRAASNLAKMQRNEGAMAAAREASAPAGAGKKTRKPAGENDGRRKRAEIVRRVMNEKGLSLIEASKYVKAHNLY